MEFDHELLREVARRREDGEFMERLRRRIDQDKRLLEQLERRTPESDGDLPLKRSLRERIHQPTIRLG